MPLISHFVNWLNIKRIHQMELFKKYPLDVQREQLFKNLDRASNTEWGKKYGFNSIKNIEAFRERVPLSSYEALHDEIQRLLKGEKNVMWPGTVKWFAKSSGTTAEKSKFIPVTNESLEENHFRGGRDVLAIYTANFPDTGIFSGKGLTLGGSHQINKVNNQSYYGDLSAILIENLPYWAHIIRTPKQKIALMDEFEKKMNTITRTTIKENVTNLSGVPSWNLVLLKNILAHTGKDHLFEIWPNMELFIHGGVSFKPYREQFEKIFPSDKMHYMETYNASEGFFAIQDDPRRDDMMLMLDHGVFYEFIPFENIHDEHPPAYHIEEVELNRNYAMIISTNSGLWRYMIGDTVIFTSKYPYRIKISGRTKHFMNAFGEEVIIDNAENALKKACQETGAVINEYTAAPVFMTDNKKGTHEWLIEFEKMPDNQDVFNDVLDKSLMELNSDYEAKRYKNITLDQPVVKIMKTGTFYKWLEDHGKLGGQNKVPRLSNERKYVEQLNKIAESFDAK
jgi:hypothetical protein